MTMFLGLVLNVLGWALMAAVLTGAVVWVVMGLFPGAARKARTASRRASAAGPAIGRRVTEEEESREYRKAS